MLKRHEEVDPGWSEARLARISIPMPLAAALDLSAGELMQWQLLARSTCACDAWRRPTPHRKPKRRRSLATGFLSGIVCENPDWRHGQSLTPSTDAVA